MFKKKAHGRALTHMAFVWFLALWASLMGDFFTIWAKLTALAKLYRVGPKNTSFRKFNLISFIKNGLWILNLI